MTTGDEMSMFGDDLPPVPAVNPGPVPPPGGGGGSPADVFAAALTHAGNLGVPGDAAGVLRGVPSLEESIAVVLARPAPVQPGEYEPAVDALAGFAAVVDHARSAVYAYARDCWAARRSVLMDWCGRGPFPVNSPEWLEGTSALSAVSAEHEGAELRLARFEAGVRKAITRAEAAAGRGDTAAIARAAGEVAAAGKRHSMPSAKTWPE